MTGDSVGNVTPPYLGPTSTGGLYWGALREGRLVRRYQRFLADVELPDGTCLTAHTANTGSMLGCSEPGRRVWLSHHGQLSRKHAYTLEMIEMPTALVGVNTGIPNKLVKTAILAKRIAELSRVTQVTAEVRHGDSRLDLLVKTGDARDVFIEIKNCTLAEEGTAYFPDAVTARGTKHLEELAKIVRGGGRAVIFIVVQRGDAERFSPADHIDPEWGRVFRQVTGEGVEAWVYRAALNLKMIDIGIRLPVRV